MCEAKACPRFDPDSSLENWAADVPSGSYDVHVVLLNCGKRLTASLELFVAATITTLISTKTNIVRIRDTAHGPLQAIKCGNLHGLLRNAVTNAINDIELRRAVFQGMDASLVFGMED